MRAESQPKHVVVWKSQAPPDCTAPGCLRRCLAWLSARRPACRIPGWRRVIFKKGVPDQWCPAWVTKES